MKKKKALESFSIHQLEIIKTIIQTTPSDEIIKMIEEIKQEHSKRKQANWNTLYSVDDLVLDYTLVQLLKENKIYTLQDLIEANVAQIEGITQQDLDDIEWAKMFFDMTPLKTAEVQSDYEVAKRIVKQANETDEYFKKKK